MALAAGFRGDERGVTAIIFSIMFTVILLGAALAIDHGRHVSAKMRDQAALDAAILAASDQLGLPDQDTAGPEKARAFYRANVGADSASTIHSVTFDAATGEVEATAGETLATTLMRALGYETMTVGVRSSGARLELRGDRARAGQLRLDGGFLGDGGGHLPRRPQDSGAQSRQHRVRGRGRHRKGQDGRGAVRGFGERGRRVSRVAVDRRRRGLLHSHGKLCGGEAPLRAFRRARRGLARVRRGAPRPPRRAGHRADERRHAVRADVRRRRAGRLRVARPRLCQQLHQRRRRQLHALCARLRGRFHEAGHVQELGGDTAAEPRRAGAHLQVRRRDAFGCNWPNAGCTTKPILPLDATKANVLDAIDAMQASGNTNVGEGLMWGWRTLSPGAPFTEGRPYESGDSSKYVVLMTDGENRISATSNHNKSVYNSYGYAAKGRLGTTYSDAGYTAKLNERMRLACSNAKAAGITIFTVAFNLAESPEVQALLRDCASGGEKALVANDGAALDQAFQSIGRQITRLRIAG